MGTSFNNGDLHSTRGASQKQKCEAMPGKTKNHRIQRSTKQQKKNPVKKQEVETPAPVERQAVWVQCKEPFPKPQLTPAVKQKSVHFQN